MKRLATALIGMLIFGALPLRASYNFPNSTDQITFGTTAMPTTGTWMALVNPNIDLNDGATHYFFSDKSGADSFDCATASTFWACGWVTGGVDHRVLAAGTYPSVPGTWYHILLTWDDAANETRLYVNGAANGTQLATLVTHTTTGQKTIGDQDGGANRQANSRIAYTAIWNSVLSGADITALAAGGCPSSYAVGNRVNYWTLVGGSVTDQWGSDNGTVTGAVSSGTNPTVCAAATTPHSISLLGMGHY